MRARNWIWLAAALAAAGCGKETGSGGGETGRRARGPVAVRTAFAERRDISETLAFTGELEAPLAVEVHPKAQGRLERFGLAEGDEVKAGEVMAELDRREPEARLALAEGQLRQAKVAAGERERERRRAEALFAQDVATEQARDAAVAAHEGAVAALAQAEAQVRLARVNLEDAQVRAPMDGVVAARRADPGAMAGPSAAIARVVQMDPLRLRASIPARLLPLLEEGKTRMAVTTDVWPGREQECVLAKVHPEVDAATRTVRAEAMLENPKGAGGWELRPGMYATAELTLATREGALAIPASAVVRVLERQLVYVVRDGTARAVEVKTGIRQGAYVEIAEGLAEGDEYVAMGQNKLTDGAAIERVGSAAGAAE